MAGIKDTFSKGITAINVKTSSMLEHNKINTHISTLESEIALLKSKVGNILWESWKNDAFDISLVEDILLTINNKMDEIENQKRRAEEIRIEEQQILGTSSNVQIQAHSSGGYIFCSNCGAKLVVGVKFCTKCGSLLER